MPLKELPRDADFNLWSKLAGNPSTLHNSPFEVEPLVTIYLCMDDRKGVSCAKSRKVFVNLGTERGRNQREEQIKPGTGSSLHTLEPVTVASFRTWRGWRENVA